MFEIFHVKICFVLFLIKNKKEDRRSQPKPPKLKNLEFLVTSGKVNLDS